MKLESALKSSQDKETELQGKLEETNKSKTQVKEKRERGREGRSDMEVVIYSCQVLEELEDKRQQLKEVESQLQKKDIIMASSQGKVDLLTTELKTKVSIRTYHIAITYNHRNLV